ncbi:hypothetical protein ABE871_17470, partial [Enterococcus gilvus]|uniref:hypothetical protein n=1 Tax=Enterococcus gilvus TaxID=160453 RepID=UPI003D6C0633
EVEEAKIRVYSGDMILYVVQNLYLLSILFLLIYYSVFLFIKINQRAYFIKRINGYSTLSNYKFFYLIFCIESLFILSWSFKISDFNENYMGASVFILFCNTVVSWISLKRIEVDQVNGG